jgi:hypothetical protein
MNTSTVCIQDKNGKHWNTLCSSSFTAPEVRNIQRHLEAARKSPITYHFLDLPTAVIMVDGKPYVEMTDDELLTELGVL